MKIVTFLGTRPEIIRLSRIIPLLDRHVDHFLVNTGQNYEASLSDIFFRQMKVRPPDHSMGVKAASFGEQVGAIIKEAEAILRQEMPDGVLILGDTNSGMAAYSARRLGIPVFHMEAGNRCFDDRVPEEVNRRVIDHSSTVLMPYTERSRANLLREGFPSDSIFVTGNPIFEVLESFSGQIQSSSVMADLDVSPRRYLLATLHRAENVDVPDRLETFTLALSRVRDEFGLPVIVSTHPRTRNRMEQLQLGNSPSGVIYSEPMGFFDFVNLEKNALCVLSDSGTVQEECCIFKVPAVTLRDVTERPETIECGSNVLSGCDADRIVELAKMVTSMEPLWIPPAEYMVPDVSSTVLRTITSFRRGRLS